MADKRKVSSKEEIAERIGERAWELQDKYHFCSQCGLLAIQEAFNLEDDMLFRAATGLSGGIGGLHDSACGALTGGVLALGLKYGRGLSDLEKPPEESIKKGQASIEVAAKLCKWFEREFGSTVCSQLRKSFIGADLDTKVPWQKQMAEELGLRKYCCDLQRKTAKKVAELMMEEE